MIFCQDRSFCEPKPKDFESSHQCCNSCNSKSCTNRCKDDCKTCGMVVEAGWIKELKNIYYRSSVLTQTDSKTDKNVVPRKKVEKVPEQPLVMDKEAKKREARRKRRLARKAKNLANKR